MTYGFSRSGHEYQEGSIINLADVKPEKVDWLWKPYFPKGKLVMLDGDGGTGKSTLLMDIMARMSRGKPMPDNNKVGEGGSVYVFFEDGASDTIVPRLIRMNADLSRIKGIKEVPFKDEKGEAGARAFMIPEDIPLLEMAVEEARARIVVIDPIMSAIESKYDVNKDPDVRKALTPLVRFAENFGVTVVMVRHYTKGKKDSLQHKGTGSPAFVNMSRVGLNIEKESPESDIKLLVHGKHNLTAGAKALRYEIKSDADEVAYVQWYDYSTLTNQQILEGNSSDSRRGDLRNDVVNLLEKTPGGCMESGKIEDYMENEKGYRGGTVRTNLTRMRGRELKKEKTFNKDCLKVTSRNL